VATPSAGALQLCPYTTFEANQPSSVECVTITFNASQPVPGLLFGTLLSSPTPNGAPLPQPIVVTASQVAGKWVLFGLTEGGSQFALIQH
jgi:hypothetical protein